MPTFDYAPDYKAEKSVKPTVQSVKFGDGYEQRAAYGLNTKPQNWTLKFVNRTVEDADAIEEFFLDAGGVDAFDWTPPGAEDALKFICREWSRVKEYAGLDTITASFEQVFDP